MKNFIFSVGILFSLFGLFIPTGITHYSESTAIRKYLAIKKAKSISCAPDRNDASLFPESPQDMVPLPGWGNHHWAIKTKSDSAQFYFDQGINMYYSFHIIESLASFQKAIYLDPMSPMPYWGLALAYGPNINDITYTTTPKAIWAVAKADSLAAGLTSFEKGLIKAMQLRYSSDNTKKRIELDGAYARAMKELYQSMPRNPDAGALYADALMLLHPWDLYDLQQQPKVWTPEIVSVLENILTIAPSHPAANHYYIHAVEASSNPGRALASADKLGSLLPMVSHMVHMPSHIYIRTGNYEKGNLVNKKAIEGYKKYTSILPSVENGAFLYLFHNLHMQAANAIMNGNFTEAEASSKQIRENIPLDFLVSAPPDGEYLQYMYITDLFCYIRYGKWDLILNQPDIPDSLAYAKILLEFSKGMANAHLHMTNDARSSLGKMEQLMKANEKLKIRMGAFNTAYAGGEVAYALLKGIIFEEENNYDEAIKYLTQAVFLEDQMIYDEPKDWLLPPRQYLAAVLIKKGLFSEAASTLKKDLEFNPNNGWALTGLWLSFKGQGKLKEAGEVKKLLETQDTGKDFNKTSPVF